MACEQPAVERGELDRIRGSLLVDADPGRQAVDRVAARERLLDDVAAPDHALPDLGRELDPRSLTRDADDLVDREIGSGEHDGHPQTIFAVSAIVRSFAHWSSWLSAFPTTVVPKPH